MKDNMLLKIKEVSILKKISIFFKNIFHKKQKFEEYNSKPHEIKQENSVISEFKENRKIMDLQKQYETSIINEEDLTEEEKEKLIELYKEQISTIKDNIQTELKKLEFYKQKIIIAREKNNEKRVK